MTIWNLLSICLNCTLLVLIFIDMLRIGDLKKRIDAMVKGREAFYSSLTDADAIMAEMERGAVAMEALQAHRRRNIRDDAGPHARIYKPKKLGRLPRNRMNYGRVEPVPDEMTVHTSNESQE